MFRDKLEEQLDCTVYLLFHLCLRLAISYFIAPFTNTLLTAILHIPTQGYISISKPALGEISRIQKNIKQQTQKGPLSWELSLQYPLSWEATL